MTGYVLKLFRSKKNETAAAVIVNANLTSPVAESIISISRCQAPSIVDSLLKRCPPHLPGGFITNVTLAAKPASSSSLTTAAVLVCVGSVGLVVAATLGTRGLRFALALAVVLLAIGAILPL